MPNRRPPVPDRGAGAVEYGAVIVLVAALIAALTTAGFGREIASGVSGAAACLLGSSSACAPPAGGTDAPGSADGGDGGAPESGAPEPPVFDYREEGSARSYECGAWQRSCDWVQGAGAEAQDAVTEVWQGLRGTGCLVHICTPEEFDRTWSALGDSAAQTAADPLGAAEEQWNAYTDGPREDYANGYDDRSAGRTLVLAGGTIFSFGGLGALKHLPKIPTRFGSAQKHLEAGEKAARKGDVSSAEYNAEAAQAAADESQREAAADPDDWEAQSRAETDRRLAERTAELVPVAEAVEGLTSTRSGRALNRVLNRHGVQIRFGESPDGTKGSYESDRNILTVDRSLRGTDDAVRVLAHESAHVQNKHAGKRDFTVHDPKDDFVDAYIEEEASAKLAEYAFLRDYRAAGSGIGKEPLEEFYDECYAKAEADLDGQGLSAKAKRAKAHEAAGAEFTDAIGDRNVEGGGTFREEAEGIWDMYN